MPASTRLDRAALTAILAKQEKVISREQAFACGMTRDALAHRARPDGTWQRLVHGIYLAQTGDPTVAQKEMAALLHGGRGSVLTGPAALRALGVTDAEPALFDVLVPESRRPRSVAFVVIHRTPRMPDRVIRDGRRLYALAPRALADTAKALTDLREARALIAGAIQRGDCPLPALIREVPRNRAPHSAQLRQVLAEALAGIRSVVEAEFKDLISRAGLPEPIFNARLLTADGTFIARPDAWWPHAGVAAEVDSREWHLNPADWERTMRRHAIMSSHGILVLHFTPRQIRVEPATVIAAIADTLQTGGGRPPLPIMARPTA